VIMTFFLQEVAQGYGFRSGRREVTEMAVVDVGCEMVMSWKSETSYSGNGLLGRALHYCPEAQGN
jgi:hypothetical protein